MRLRRGEKLFIILDEILRGTNSVDKQTGSLALIRQLVGAGATGIIATHDLALGKLADSLPGKSAIIVSRQLYKETNLLFLIDYSRV